MYATNNLNMPNDVNFVQLLLDHGTDVKMTNNEGDTALSIATKNDFKRLFTC